MPVNNQFFYSLPFTTLPIQIAKNKKLMPKYGDATSNDLHAKGLKGSLIHKKKIYESKCKSKYHMINNKKSLFWNWSQGLRQKISELDLITVSFPIKW